MVSLGLADLAASMGLSSVNVTEAINKRERRPSDLSSNASNASSVHVSLTPCGPELVRVTLDISELLQEASPAPPS